MSLVGCDPARPTPPDAGLDAPSDARDAPPPDPCPLLGPLLEVTSSSCPELDVGDRFCVAQDGCALSIVDGAASATTATVAERAASLELGGITCVASLDDEGGAALECDDRLGIGCTVDLRGIAVADAPTCCLPGGSTCVAPDACTLVAPDVGAIATTACVERTGSVAEGATCARGAPGHDDCAAGLFCTALGAPLGERLCRRLCLGDGDCAAGDACTAAGVVPPVGVCATRCDPFAAPDACGAELGCQPIAALAAGSTVTTCAAVGTAALGELCEATGCAAGLVCALDTGTVVSRCRTYCDDTHPCGGTETCRAFDDGAPLGVCVEP